MRSRRRITVKVSGRQSERTFPLSTSARTIQDWKDRERARLEDAEPRTTRGTLTKDVDTHLDSLADKPKLKKERTYQLGWWTRRFGTLRRSDISAVMIRTALAELRRHREASTCNHYRDALAAVWTTIDGKDGRSPFRNVPKFTEPESEPRDLPRTLIMRVLDTMADHSRGQKGKRRGTVSFAKLRLCVTWTSGLSPAEIMRVQPSDLFLDAAAVYARRREKGKGVEGMLLPLTPDGVAAFRAFADASAFGRFSTHSVYKAFRRACRKLLARDAALADDAKEFTDIGRRLLERARPYDLRHTFGTFVFRQTGDLQTTKELMRQRSTKTTKRYMRGAIPEHLRAAIQSLPAGTIQPTTPQKAAS